jgi:hypothetical protein
MSLRTVKQMTNNKFLNIKEVFDEANHCKGYQFAERRGVDSIAFICYDENTNRFFINKEYTPPTGEFLVRAFGGSLDKDVDKIHIVIDEVKEEVGIEVTSKNIYPVGSVFVSTQMNQRCYLYFVDVSYLKRGDRMPENEMEKMASVLCLGEDEIINNDDWKAIVIINKAKKAGLLK